jgi:hypothetical protein
LKKQFYIVLMILGMLYSCDHIHQSLPRKFKCQKLNTYNSSSFEVKVYSVNLDKFSETDLFNYHVKCCKECLTDRWMKIDLELEEHERIYRIVKETSDLINSDGLKELLTSFENGSTIYISTCYTMMKSNGVDEFKYYDRMFFLDLKHSKFYQFKAIKGSIFGPA